MSRRTLIRPLLLTLAAGGTLTALSASCADDSCEVTLTCPPPGSGGGAGQGGGSGAAGGDGLQNGDACTDPSECNSGNCADGVCCDAACDGVCVACNLTGAEGSCGPVQAGESDDSCDDVCDGSGHCVSGAHLWSQRFDATVGLGVAVDGAGNVIMTGNYGGTGDLGTGPLPGGDQHVFLAKYDPMGNALWSKGYGGTATENAKGNAVAIDSNESIILTGDYGLAGTGVSFGGLTLPWNSEYDAFLAKYASSNQHLWSKTFTATCDFPAYAVAVDSSDNIAIGGEACGELDLGGGTRTGDGAYLGIFSPTGVHQWDRYLSVTGTSRLASARGVAFDSQDSVVVVGHFRGNMTTGGPSLTAAGTSAFVAKYDDAGSHLWSANFGDASQARAVAVASDDSIVIGGYYSASIDFGGGTLPTGGGNDIFVVKLDSDGNHLWSHGFGEADDQQLFGLAVDAHDNIVITGGFSGVMDLGGGSMTAAGEDVFIAKLSTGGDHVWSQRFGDSSMQAGYAVATDADSNIFFTGEMRGGTDFGGGALSTAGPIYADPFLVKLAP